VHGCWLRDSLSDSASLSSPGVALVQVAPGAELQPWETPPASACPGAPRRQGHLRPGHWRPCPEQGAEDHGGEQR
jgi:hypothetical protein